MACTQQHNVFSLYDEARGMEDDVIIRKGFTEDWIIVTNDKDFGEKVYRERHPDKGIIFLRLDDERPANKIVVLQRLLARYIDQLPGQFVVVTETQVRFVQT